MPQQIEAPEENQAWAVIECFQIPLAYFNNKATKQHSIKRITMTQGKIDKKTKKKRKKKNSINVTRIPENNKITLR